MLGLDPSDEGRVVGQCHALGTGGIGLSLALEPGRLGRGLGIGRRGVRRGLALDYRDHRLKLLALRVLGDLLDIGLGQHALFDAGLVGCGKVDVLDLD